MQTECKIKYYRYPYCRYINKNQNYTRIKKKRNFKISILEKDKVFSKLKKIFF